MYQRAVAIPSSHLDSLWKMYEAFENSGYNRPLAKKMFDDIKPKHQAARQVQRERKKKLEGIRHDLLAFTPGMNKTRREYKLENNWIWLWTARYLPGVD